MSKYTIKNFLLLLLLSLSFTACSNDEDKDEVIIYLNVNLSVNDNEVSGSEESFFLQIETQGKWDAAVADDWCLLNKPSGTGNASVICTVAPNISGEKRSTTITVTAGDKEKIITLTQRAQNTSRTFENENRIEIPKLKGGAMNLAYSHYTTYKNKKTITFSAEYDCTKKHTRWIAFTFYDETSEKHVKRTDAWADDPLIPIKYRTYKNDYNGSGYTRGHLCASEDRVYSKEANEQTFYYSNMSPQIGNAFNGGIWLKMEEKVQTWGKETSLRDTLYVVKGGTIDDAKILKYAGNGVAVPKYYFMAVLARKNDQYKAMAFYIEHKSYSAPYNVTQYAMPVDELEEKTGINFFHNLPPEIESTVEATFDKNQWPGL